MRLIQGDCLEVIKTLPDNSVDSCVTDPPYGLKFMGKKWDYNVPTVEQWQEVYRVMKPGAFLLSFGGTRTYHRMVVNIEDAGFEIRDQIQWLYGSGFPKSLDIGKAIDRAAGVERTEGKRIWKGGLRHSNKLGGGSDQENGTTSLLKYDTPATPEAEQWDGWGTALKPANEPICLARKPLSEKTVAANVLKWGTGGLNIDGCRVGTEELSYVSDMSRMQKWSKEQGARLYTDGFKSGALPKTVTGRWPANVIHSGEDEVVGLFPNVGGPWGKDSKGESHGEGSMFGIGGVNSQNELRGRESGSAARFFYVAKASKAERGEGNNHPTVKPLKLMCYLCRLVTPPGGTVLDCYVGSGTTGVAAQIEGFDFIGIDKDIDIATRRIEDTDPLFQAVEVMTVENMEKGRAMP